MVTDKVVVIEENVGIYGTKFVIPSGHLNGKKRDFRKRISETPLCFEAKDLVLPP